MHISDCLIKLILAPTTVVANTNRIDDADYVNDTNHIDDADHVNDTNRIDDADHVNDANYIEKVKNTFILLNEFMFSTIFAYS
ncbi:unnamed protein product [Cercopithifilaria johnstoni]|uniref:Uncharacterized protein n=1 Tax=Cercopithifilaria johnstoni TaxID=2874296 RepID=A0A8J2Q6K3_9BILA|nr:unnamed protein product [Cercopithifilaria johnstoni]